MKVLTPDQLLLVRYLSEIGMSLPERILVVIDLWEPEATDEMLRFIGETLENDPAKLSKKACEIERKYRREWEEADEEETFDETETSGDL